MNKLILCCSISVALWGCESTENARFVGEPVAKTSTVEREVGKTNVMYEFDGIAVPAPKQSPLVFPEDKVPEPYKPVAYNIEKAKPKPKPKSVVTQNTQQSNNVAPDNTINAPSAEVVVNKVGENIVQNSIEDAIDGNESEDLSLFNTLTPEDRIMTSVVDPVEYQIIEKKFAHSKIVKTTDNVQLFIDEEKVKAYLINQYYNTNKNKEDDRDEIARPTSQVVFKGVAGTLKENIELLFASTDGVKTVIDISENHFFDYEFEVRGDNTLKILDNLIDSFKTPHPLHAKPYNLNKVVHIYYAR